MAKLKEKKLSVVEPSTTEDVEVTAKPVASPAPIVEVPAHEGFEWTGEIKVIGVKKYRVFRDKGPDKAVRLELIV